MVDGKVVYTGVIKVDSVSKNELYNRAKLFFVKNYKSANDVLQLDDKETGQIIGKGIFKIPTGTGLMARTSTVLHRLSITVKDGRYKYEVANLVEVFNTPGVGSGENSIDGYVLSKKKYSQSFIIDVHDYVSKFVQSLIDEMGIKSEKKDDW